MASTLTAAPERGIRTIAYVDGFNLYYGCLKGTPYKWLNIHAMLQALLPRNDIHRIKYFTARIKPRPEDPRAATRQQAYIRALQTVPSVEMFYGHYLTHEVRMRLAHPLPHGPKTAMVIRTEEKGSDVNLATHLVGDAYEGRFDCAVVVTNDSDLTMPLERVRSLRYSVGLINPHATPAKTLLNAASFVRQIRAGVLRESQFPTVMSDDHGTFRKPSGW
ncbi:MAG: hypothetical protein RLZZ621_637 [Gemmatimonadota bacterium]